MKEPFKIFNTLTKEYNDVFPPAAPDSLSESGGKETQNPITIYTCGPTVYSQAHIGNFRAFLLGDLLHRTLKAVQGFSTKWVVNITDIDDKTIARCNDTNFHKPEMAISKSDNSLEKLKKFTRYYESVFIDDLSAVGVDVEGIYQMPRATDYIEEMKALIGLLSEKGYAYHSKGSVYFDVEAWEVDGDYGRLKKIDTIAMLEQAEQTQDRIGEKKSPLDFVLWKAAKPGEPSWNLEFTKFVDESMDGQDSDSTITIDGRPGWHLECSAMSNATLGLPVDIHTGGIDLCFPHHEDELAQSSAGYGVEPVRFWMHNEFLDLDGEKMSKSTGNIWNLVDLKANGITPLEYRFAILSQHYRKKISFSLDSCQAAAKGMQRIQNNIYAAYERLSQLELGTSQPETNTDSVEYDQKEIAIAIEKVSYDFDCHLRNDLNTPRAIATVHSFFGNFNIALFDKMNIKSVLAFIDKLQSVFGVWKTSQKEKESVPSEVRELAEQRLTAKQNKDWNLADSLRAKITQSGYEIKDKTDGYDLSKI
jgi:cysteinyl-tRNA synthetase